MEFCLDGWGFINLLQSQSSLYIQTSTASTSHTQYTSFHQHASSFRSTSDVRSMIENDDDEVELQWAAIERLPTFERIRVSLFGCNKEEDGHEGKSKRAVDVTKLGALERHMFIDKLLEQIQGDNQCLVQKLKERIDR